MANVLSSLNSHIILLAVKIVFINVVILDSSSFKQVENIIKLAIKSSLTMLYCGSVHTWAILKNIRILIDSGYLVLYQPFLTNFFFTSTDEGYIKLEKLKIISLLACED